MARLKKFSDQLMSPLSDGQMGKEPQSPVTASLLMPVYGLLGDANPSESHRLEMLCSRMSGELIPRRAELLSTYASSATVTVNTPQMTSGGIMLWQDHAAMLCPLLKAFQMPKTLSFKMHLTRQ